MTMQVLETNKETKRKAKVRAVKPIVKVAAVADEIKIDSAQIQNFIEQRLIKAGKDFLTIPQLFKSAAAGLRLLGLNSKAKTPAIIPALTPHLGEAFTTYKRAKSTYILRNKETADLILTLVANQTKARTVKQWSSNAPLELKSLVKAVNGLLQIGQLSVQISDNGNSSYLHPAVIIDDSSSTQPILPTSILTPDEEEKAFREGFDKVRNGKETIYIHKLRTHLNWTREHFDTVLARLRAAYKLDLHAGNPERMTEQEVADSYEDAHGFLNIGLSWEE